MARLANLGGETGAVVSEGAAHRWGAAESFVTSPVRSGTNAWSFSPGGSAGDCASRFGFTGAFDTNYWFDGWFYVTANPSSLFSVLVATDASGTAFAGIRLQTNGTLTLRDVNAGADVGSASAAVPLSSWFRISLRVKISAAGTDEIEAFLGGVSFAAQTGVNVSATAPGFFEFGGQSTMPASYVLLMDDALINDSTGTAENVLPTTDRHLVLLLPASQASITASTWQKPGGATTNLNTSVDNVPPVGVADSTSSANAEKQIRDAVNNATANVTFNMTDYTTAGVGGSDTVNLIQALAVTGAPSATSPKTGSLQVASNPAGGETNFGNFYAGAVAGTFPTGWVTRFDPVIYAPTVTKGTQPTLEVGNRTGSTRIALVSLAGIYVDYTPAAAAQNAPAGSAAGTGVASNASESVATASAASAGSGIANQAGPKVQPNAGGAAGAGAAGSVGGTAAGSAGIAAASGTASNAAAAPGKAATPTAATASAAASDARTATAAPAGKASGAGASFAAGGTAAATIGRAAGSGAAAPGASDLGTEPAAAAGIGASAGPHGSLAAGVGGATATGAATSSRSAISAAAGSPTATAAAFAATVTTSGAGQSAAAVRAAGTGAAFGGRTAVSIGLSGATGIAVATAAVATPTVALSAPVTAAIGLGQAYAAGPSVFAHAGTAAATGTAADPLGLIAAAATMAQGFGAAFDATSPVAARVTIALAVSLAHGATIAGSLSVRAALASALPHAASASIASATGSLADSLPDAADLAVSLR